MRMIDAADLPDLVTQEDALAAARDAASARAAGEVIDGRVQFDWANGESGVRIMGAAMPSLGIFGYKQFHWIDGGVWYACHIFRASDGAPLGVVDAASITTLRTAATAAVGVEALYGSDRKAVVAVIGSGAEAQAGLRALARVVPIRAARVYSRNTVNREIFATRMNDELALPVIPVDTLRKATDGVDIVYSATQSNGSVVYHADDVAGAAVVATIGSTSPDQREAAGDVFARASRILIDTEDAIAESGDLIEAALAPESFELLGTALAAPARRTEPYSVFKSIGSPEQDLVLAAHILRRAEEHGVGRTVAPAMSRKQNL
ncbi:hypothetical protein GCM10023205_68640 [Yinghuangia aomiensis]|uniref:Ornithine cyclodeaminase n=1 Tax=Yinghuangia aomiensis TaxID=676205 RepID=A0ABP9I4Z9_9ACTN